MTDDNIYGDDFDHRQAELEQDVLAAIIKAYDQAQAAIDIDALADAIETGDDALIAAGLNLDEGLHVGLEQSLSDAFLYMLLGGLFLAMSVFTRQHRSRANANAQAFAIREELRRKAVDPLARRASEAALITIKLLKDAAIHPRLIAEAVQRNLALSPDQARSAAYFQRGLNAGMNHRLATNTGGVVTLPSQPRQNILNIHKAALNAAQRSILLKALSGELTIAGNAKLVARHTAALASYRQQAIARQEASRAIQLGEYIAFRQGKANRSLPRTAKRFWKTAGDERVRHHHTEVPGMNAEGVDVGEPFQTPLGPFLYPPLEVNCRCRVVVRTPEE